MSHPGLALCALAFLVHPHLLRAQPTNAVITGSVTTSDGGSPVGFVLYAESRGGLLLQKATLDAQGWFSFLAIPPGRYRIRVCWEVSGGAPDPASCLSSNAYQAREISNLDVPAAGFLRLDFVLRPLGDVYSQAFLFQQDKPGSIPTVMRLYTADRTGRSVRLEAAYEQYRGLEATLSNVTDPREMRNLPYFGRDAYTLLGVQPTAANSTSARGLGLSLGGLRPGTGTFFLDGQNLTGGIVSEPLVALAPEAISEYRTSVANYSSDFGRSASFVTNAVSAVGGNDWHGIGYFHFGDEALDANDFQRNMKGLPRRPFIEKQGGGQAGGPLDAARGLFLSASADSTISRSFDDPLLVRVITREAAANARRINPTLAPDPFTIIDRYTPSTELFKNGVGRVSQPITLRRWSGLGRIDGIIPGTDSRFFARYLLSARRWPDFVWSPYPAFTSPLDQPSQAVAGQWSLARPATVHEVRIGWARERTAWQRAHDDLPSMLPSFSNKDLGDWQLPGSPASYSFDYGRSTYEMAYGWTGARQRNLWKAGAQLYRRSTDTNRTGAVGGALRFSDATAFLNSRSNGITLGVLRREVDNGILRGITRPALDARAHGTDLAVHASDRFRLARSSAPSLGVRLERFAGPRLQFSEDNSEQLVPRTRAQIRAGLSHGLTASGRLLVRVAYGLFSDLTADSVWLSAAGNPAVLVARVGGSNVGTQFLSSREVRFGSLIGSSVNPLDSVVRLWPLRLAEDLGRGYAQHSIAGVAWNPSRRVNAEAHGILVRGRRLVLSDLASRSANEYLSRSGRGGSNYSALSTSARYQAGALTLQGVYTLASAHDHQSDAFSGDFADLGRTVQRGLSERTSDPALMAEGDTALDWGHADYHQRHNLSFTGFWRPEPSEGSGWVHRLSKGWQLSWIGRARSSLPFTVSLPGGPGIIFRNLRASGTALAALRQPVPGGVRLLDSAAFATEFRPQAALPRNSFTPPGQAGLDLSAQRIAWSNGNRRLWLRCDCFNCLNQPPLGDPETTLTATGFGVAQYGRRAASSGLPFVTPAEDSARQIRLMLRFEF